MNIQPNISVSNIFILGAGASVDYGLPTWKQLSGLVKEELKNDLENKYKFKKEILEWLKKVDNNEYITIDECIQKESIHPSYHSNGHLIENQIFIIIKNIFDKLYSSTGGWIRKLNEIILHDRLDAKLFFINYNYDNVLEKNLLNFDYLTQKQRLITHRERLDELSGVKFEVLYPHGNLYKKEDLLSSHTKRHFHTAKSGQEGFVDAVSCYESETHEISLYNNDRVSLYILGLGGGLEQNLNNIKFSLGRNHQIKRVHITIKDSERRNMIVDYLKSKFIISESEIIIYDDCEAMMDGRIAAASIPSEIAV